MCDDGLLRSFVALHMRLNDDDDDGNAFNNETSDIISFPKKNTATHFYFIEIGFNGFFVWIEFFSLSLSNSMPDIELIVLFCVVITTWKCLNSNGQAWRRWSNKCTQPLVVQWVGKEFIHLEYWIQFIKLGASFIFSIFFSVILPIHGAFKWLLFLENIVEKYKILPWFLLTHDWTEKRLTLSFNPSLLSTTSTRYVT